MPVQKAALKMQEEEAEERHSAGQRDLEAAGQNVGRAEGLNGAGRMEWSRGPACGVQRGVVQREGCRERGMCGGCAERGEVRGCKQPLLGLKLRAQLSDTIQQRWVCFKECDGATEVTLPEHLL